MEEPYGGFLKNNFMRYTAPQQTGNITIAKLFLQPTATIRTSYLHHIGNVFTRTPKSRRPNSRIHWANEIFQSLLFEPVTFTNHATLSLGYAETLLRAVSYSSVCKTCFFQPSLMVALMCVWLRSQGLITLLYKCWYH
jgi:hypothetical protein